MDLKRCCEIKLNIFVCFFSAHTGFWVAAQISPCPTLHPVNYLRFLTWCLSSCDLDISKAQSPSGPVIMSCWERSISKTVVSACTIYMEWHKLGVFHYPGPYMHTKYLKCSMSSHVFFFFKLPWLSSFNILFSIPSPFWKAWNCPLEFKTWLKTVMSYTILSCQKYLHFCIQLRELCVFQLLPQPRSYALCSVMEPASSLHFPGFCGRKVEVLQYNQAKLGNIDKLSLKLNSTLPAYLFWCSI